MGRVDWSPRARVVAVVRMGFKRARSTKMSLIVDCYNVLHVTMPPLLAGLDEGRLCAVLDRTPWADSAVTVVADGRPKPLRQ